MSKWAALTLAFLRLAAIPLSRADPALALVQVLAVVFGLPVASGWFGANVAQARRRFHFSSHCSTFQAIEPSRATLTPRSAATWATTSRL